MYLNDFDAKAREVRYGHMSPVSALKRKASPPPESEVPTSKRVARESAVVSKPSVVAAPVSGTNPALPEIAPTPSGSTAQATIPVTTTSPEINGTFITLVKVYIIADTWDIKGPRGSQIQSPPSPPPSIRLLYEGTLDSPSSRAFKAIPITSARINLPTLLKRSDFRQLIKECGEIALDIFDAVLDVQAQKKVAGVTCKNCKKDVLCPGRANHLRGSTTMFVRREEWVCGVGGCGLSKSRQEVRCTGCACDQLVPVVKVAKAPEASTASTAPKTPRAPQA